MQFQMAVYELHVKGMMIMWTTYINNATASTDLKTLSHAQEMTAEKAHAMEEDTCAAPCAVNGMLTFGEKVPFLG
jgi:hypothetical protein